jgi:hypothetical protein
VLKATFRPFRRAIHIAYRCAGRLFALACVIPLINLKQRITADSNKTIEGQRNVKVRAHYRICEYAMTVSFTDIFTARNLAVLM